MSIWWICVMKILLITIGFKGGIIMKVIKGVFLAGNISFLRFQGRATQWVALILECGHVVGRYISKDNFCYERMPKNATCEFCTNNEDTIERNLDYSSDKLGFARDPFTGIPEKRVDNEKN